MISKCSDCSDVITDQKTGTPIDFDFHADRLCILCEEQSLLRSSEKTAKTWDIDFDCPAGPDKIQ
jgi:hypothetical protein